MKMFFKVMTLIGFVLASTQVKAFGWGGAKESFANAGNQIRNAGEAVRDQFNGKAKARAAAQQSVNEKASALNKIEVDLAMLQQKLAAAQAERARAQMELNAAQAELQRLN